MSTFPELAEPEQTYEIAALIEAAFADYSRRLGSERNDPIDDWIVAAIADRQLHVVKRDGGLAAVIKITDTPEENTMTLDIFAVAPAFARQGLGSSLLDWFEAYARAAGRTMLTLHTAKMMTHLVAFYHRHGYQTVRIGPPPHGNDTHPRVFMQKRLHALTAR